VGRILCGSIALCLIPLGFAQAEGLTIDEVKGRIFDAKMLQQTFMNGLKFCSELNGNNFYFPPRDRVLDLDEYHRSLENLAKQQMFNPERKRPWTEEDAADRWQQVKRQATKDKENCQLVASLPDLQKQLTDMEKQAAEATADKKN
jgi:predicted extracellular nuclease